MKNFIYLIAYYSKDNQLSFIYKGIQAKDEGDAYNKFNIEDSLLKEIENVGGKAVNNLVIEIPKVMIDTSKIPSSISIEEYLNAITIENLVDSKHLIDEYEKGKNNKEGSTGRTDQEELPK